MVHIYQLFYLGYRTLKTGSSRIDLNPEKVIELYQLLHKILESV